MAQDNLEQIELEGWETAPYKKGEKTYVQCRKGGKYLGKGRQKAKRLIPKTKRERQSRSQRLEDIFYWGWGWGG
jgi:hypothetical protein